MADDYLDPRVNVVSSDADVERTLKDDKREGRNALSYAPVDWGSGGQVDRSAMQAELDNNPNLHARLQQMVRGEVGGSASPEVRRIQMESVMNRALVRGHSLEQGLWDVGQYGNKGYYPPQTFSRGGYNNDDYQADLASVLGGSNYGGKYLPSGHLVTGNASADVARHQFQRGTPGFTLDTGSGPESYFNEDAHRAEPMARLLSGGGPMATALGGSRPPMQMASADITGSVPQGRRQMPTPMDEASSPGILDRLTQNIQNPERVTDALGNAGAWLMARDNPAGGAALLASLKKDKNAGEWSHQIDPNTGTVVSINNKTGVVKQIPLMGYDKDKATKEAYDKAQVAADVKLNTDLAEQGAALPGMRADLASARDAFNKVHDANPTFTKVKTVAAQLGIPVEGLSDIQVAQAVSNKMAIAAKNIGGKNSMPGNFTDQDRDFLTKEVAQPSNTKEANQRILDIYEKQLARQERIEKQRQDHVKSNTRFNGNAFRQQVADQDAQEAAAAAAAPPPQPSAAPLQLPKGVKSIQLIQ